MPRIIALAVLLLTAASVAAGATPAGNISFLARGDGAFAKTDFWIMNANGSDKRRVTRFNDKAAPEYIPGHAIAADSSWSPDGKKFVGYIENNATATKAGDIAVVTPE